MEVKSLVHWPATWSFRKEAKSLHMFRSFSELCFTLLNNINLGCSEPFELNCLGFSSKLRNLCSAGTEDIRVTSIEDSHG